MARRPSSHQLRGQRARPAPGSRARRSPPRAARSAPSRPEHAGERREPALLAGGVDERFGHRRTLGTLEPGTSGGMPPAMKSTKRTGESSGAKADAALLVAEPVEAQVDQRSRRARAGAAAARTARPPGRSPTSAFEREGALVCSGWASASTSSAGRSRSTRARPATRPPRRRRPGRGSGSAARRHRPPAPSGTGEERNASHSSTVVLVAVQAVRVGPPAAASSRIRWSSPARESASRPRPRRGRRAGR